jgi:hypothetical protein
MVMHHCLVLRVLADLFGREFVPDPNIELGHLALQSLMGEISS